MTTMWKLFVDDLKRLTSNVASIIIVIGLVVIPALFTWFNVAACWDPFSNMSNMKFAIANTDEGYKSDLVPVKITVGDQVVNSLRANSQLDWTITNKEDALDGVKSGKYYAAIVIPEAFSKDMMTFFSSDVQHAELTYYRNEKKNAVAPNLLNEGADEVSAQINTAFTETITSTALDIASSLTDQLSDPNAQTQLTAFNSNIEDFAKQLGDAADALTSYGTLTDSAQSLLANSNDLISQVSGAANSAQSDLNSAKSGITNVADALSSTTDTMTKALDTSANSFESVANSIDSMYSDASSTSTTTAKGLRDQASAVDGQIAQYQNIRTQLLTIDGITEDSSIIKALDGSIDRQGKLRDALNKAADDIEKNNSSAQQNHDEVKDLANQAKQAISGVKTDFTTNVQPKIDQLNSTVSNAAGLLGQSSTQLNSTLNDLNGTSTEAQNTLTDVHSTLDSMSSKLKEASNKLSTFNTTLKDALSSGDMSTVKEVLGSDTSTLAATLASPVQLERKALFPVENFGSSMTPFYGFIPLWVGALLLVVTFKTTVSRKTRQMLGDPKPFQLFLGHFGIFALIAMAQAAVSFAGCLLFLRVQAVHPWLFMLAGIVSSLVYAFFTYTMVVSFGNVGKAIAVLLLIVQISGANGAYPLQVLPDFITKISPFLPLTHSITMLRAAIAGVYQGDYWIAMGKLLLFIPPLLLLGLLLRKPLVKFNQWYVAKVESTKLLT